LSSPPFALGATASSGLPVTYTLLSGPASLVNDTVQLTGPGAISVQAGQPGDATYLPAASVNQTFNVIAPVTLQIPHHRAHAARERTGPRYRAVRHRKTLNDHAPLALSPHRARRPWRRIVSARTAIAHLQFEKASLPSALRALGRACDTTILAEPDVTGDITVELNGTTLGGALAALTEPQGYYFEPGAGGIVVKKLKTVLYPLDYPQLTRSGSGSASITLGGANNGAFGSNAPPLSNPAGNQNGLSQTTRMRRKFPFSQDNQNTFWATLEAELRAMLREGETLVLNRFSGIAQITAPARRHETIKAFIDLTNRRITQQVEIEARLVEVTLRDERKLGGR